MPASYLSVILFFGMLNSVWAEGPVNIRAFDIQTLRHLINQKKEVCELPTQTWTDDPIRPGTPIKKIHIDEMRAAVAASYAAKAVPSPGYSDDPIIAKVTPIKATHLLEITAVNAALACSTISLKCSSLTPNPMVRPAGWGTLSMPTTGFMTASFVATETGPIKLPVVVATHRAKLGVCVSVLVRVKDSSGFLIGGNSYPMPTWPNFNAKCVHSGGAGYNNVTSNITFNVTMGETYTIEFGYRKVASGVPNSEAWSWTTCSPG